MSYNQEQIDRALELRKKQVGKRRMSLARVAKKVGAENRSIVWFWEQQDSSEKARKERLAKRGRKSSMTQEHRDIMRGFLVSKGETATHVHLKTFVNDSFGYHFTGTWARVQMKKHAERKDLDRDEACVRMYEEWKEGKREEETKS